MRKTLFISLIVCGAALANAGSPSMKTPTVKSPAETYTAPAAVVNPSIPMSMTFGGEKIDLGSVDAFERLDRELTSMAFTHGNTLLTIKRANRYFPIMAPILKEYGIPEDLLYLACVESYLDPRAKSGAGAAGPWQFMPATGRSYGLEVNDYVDERLDPVLSTHAACKYLSSAHKQFGNWETAAASYNAGTGGISSRVSKQGQKSAFDLHMPNETMRYIYRLLAMKMIIDNPKDYGFVLTPDQLYYPIKYDVVEVNTSVPDWISWAKNHGCTYLQLREANPWIVNTSLPNKSGKVYRVNVPTKDALSRKRLSRDVYNKNWVR